MIFTLVNSFDVDINEVPAEIRDPKYCTWTLVDSWLYVLVSNGESGYIPATQPIEVSGPRLSSLVLNCQIARNLFKAKLHVREAANNYADLCN